MTPRIAPLEPPYTKAVGEQLREMMPPGVTPLGLFRTLVKNLPMTRAMRVWGGYELGGGLSLRPRDREIVIDRACGRCGAEYEWGVHVAFFAERVRLTAAQVASLAGGDSGDPCWDDEGDRLLIDAVDQLHDTCDIDDRLWARLRAVFDEAQLLDLMLLAGWYRAISYVARAARVALEPGAPTFESVAGDRG